MVTTDISQLNAECNTWKTNLRSFREELNKYKTSLQDFASRQIPKNTLQDVEHYQNQFQIQLFNIHDLKQTIKDHERLASQDLKDGKGITESVWSKHESLYESYHQLEQTLLELKDEFGQFIQKNN